MHGLGDVLGYLGFLGIRPEALDSDPAGNAELREDGAFELREDGSVELRE